MAKRAIYMVSIAGQNISSRIAPMLISLRIVDNEGTHSDTAEIVLDDSNGMIALPRDGDPMIVALGWEGGGLAEVFVGTVDEVRSNGSRGGGRELHISGKGMDTKGKCKEGQQMHADNATVGDVLNKAGKKAGISVQVDPSFASVKREWWGLNDESFIHFGERTARELGGVFKVQGNKAILAKKGGGSVSGAAMSVTVGSWGLNLISWDIMPFTGRPRHKSVRARYYDKKEAKWKETEAQVQDQGAQSVLLDRYSRADEGEAKGSADNGARESEKEKGGGSASIDGSASARAGGTFILVGTRAGVDGAYRIETVTHNYTRSGWTTDLSLKQPQGG
ncbi:phage late control D family protein [Hyphomicrobium sulfonivorans]|uniref:phage late control D family protein n=1 Tax=Hyphomicrobium sulfonivorans TaxID=121290 RepID=UPI00156E0534|nr:late control protein [Hyphomicrobium sulfonivorans]MBI1649888.1 late control protein [Hyphomicrobium sulfonivorans]NSL71799.1 late control protein [Hyphomicrobium sulfonivorans]